MRKAWETHIETIARELCLLSEECAKEANEWLAINDAEKALHKVRQAFKQELENDDDN